MEMTREQKVRAYYVAVVVAVVVLLIILYMWYQRSTHAPGESMLAHTKNRVCDNPGNPQHYEYGDYLMKRAAQGGPPHGRRVYDGNRGHDHGAGGVSRVNFDDNNGYHANDGVGEQFAPREGMMNTAHWDQAGTYQHTDRTWGLPTGEGRVNYSGYSKEGMMNTAHWDQDGTYGHTAATLPSFGLSGYYEDVPTDPSS